MSFEEAREIELLNDENLFAFIPHECAICGCVTNNYDPDCEKYFCSSDCYLTFLEEEIDGVMDLTSNEP